MLSYLTRRILLAIPTLLIISLATFALSRYTDADPVQIDYALNPAAYRAKVVTLGLDKPQFYVSLTNSALPDTLIRIFPLEDRNRLEHLVNQNGNWEATSRYWQAITTELDPVLKQISGQVFVQLSTFRLIKDLRQIPDQINRAQRHIDTVSLPPKKKMLQTRLYSIQKSYLTLKNTPQRWKLLIPALHWHGLDNQYHKWLSGFLTGNPGKSIVTGNPLLVELRPRLLVTLLLNGTAMLLAYLIGVPLGVFMARHYQRRADRWLRTALLFLYAMPVIWLGSLLILLLSRSDIGLGWINGLNAEPWLMSGKTFGRWTLDNLEKFILPVLTLTLHALAILAMQMRGGILEVVQQDYIRTARAKGLSERLVFWRHAFRNALFPIITVFAGFFPAIFSGSLVVEYLFDFPGMGTKMGSAFANNDYAVLFAMVMFVSVVTILGNLLADLLYAWADPRVRFAKH
ncbi:MAG: ABC transporter permease [Lewinellaceae bacterium]|nr:ABC transporter permease [Saprospiraceae bacterium]MCB9334230.1 ABC transporter permease [Lewinellaceae bacterium]